MQPAHHRLGLLAAAVLLFANSTILLKAQQPAQQAPAAQTISLTEALTRAQQNEPAFAAANAAQKSAAIDRYLAKASMLPTATYHNQVLYTQPNGQTNQGGQVGTQAAPIFIANNAVHEYTSQASIDETIGLRQAALARVATADAARATAELEVARRGLVQAVVSLYYQVAATADKQRFFEEALQEANTFTDLTQKREQAREIAHADVVKAQLQQQQRQRDLSDATVEAQKARLELGVLLFPDPRTPYNTEAITVPPPLPARADVDRLASTANPELRSALAEVQSTDAGTLAAKAAYLPDLGLNFTYGIDAPQFAKNGPDGVHNLGYSMSATLDIPVWDWFSTQKRVKQSELVRDVAKVNLTATQRHLIAALDEAYAEASAAQQQTAILDQSVQTAAESLRLTRLRYTAGESTALEVVDAQDAYVKAQTDRADGVARYQDALAALQMLTGTL
jgi:outer membrane protein TolC